MSDNGTENAIVGLDEVAPAFEFAGLPRSWGKRWQRSVRRASELQLEAARLQRKATAFDKKQQGEDSEEINAERETIIEQQVEILQALEDIGSEQEDMLAQVLRYVPEDWLAEGAPDDLDWSDPVSLDWIQETFYPDVLRSVMSARFERSKN